MVAESRHRPPALNILEHSVTLKKKPVTASSPHPTSLSTSLSTCSSLCSPGLACSAHFI